MRIVKGDGFYIHGQVENINVDWLVDTGCTITILSKERFLALKEEDRPTLVPYSRELRSVDDSAIEVLGATIFNVGIGNKWFQHSCIVADIANDGLFGVDFMKEHGVVIDFAQNQVTCDGNHLQTRFKQHNKRVCRVSLGETTVIPPSSRVILQGKTSKPLANGLWIIEPLTHSPGYQTILTAKVLTTACGSSIPVELMNPTETEIKLEKFTNLGIASRIQENDLICSLDIQVSEKESKPETKRHKKCRLPSELNDLVDEIEENISVKDRKKIERLLQDNLEVFGTKEKPFGRTDLVKHDIVVENSSPIKQPMRRIPFHLRPEADNEVNKMLQSGVIEPSSSPWAAPVVLVRKKDGTIRYCIDYRKLNDVTKKDSYPLPRIDDSLDVLGKANYFSTLDLASGYWQIQLTDEAKEKSAFSTNSGLYQFTVMPFGLTNAPATFQRLMERVLAGLQWHTCLVYIDDIIIFSETIEEHLKQIQSIFDRLKQAKLKLKPKKCKLLQTKVKYLGHVVSKDGVETDPDKIAVVKEWPRPSCVKDVRSFVGFCSYYRRFIPHFATVAKPLIRLTEKKVNFVWNDEHEEAWLELRRLMSEAPVLSYPDKDATFILDTDASDYGIGAVLSQSIDGKEYVIAYGSRVLSRTERRYCITRRELLAVIHFIKLYKHYLIGKKFLVRTDHAALKWLKSFKHAEGQVARWLQQLEEYDFEIEHREGRKHQNADGLSRGPCPQCQLEHEGEKIRRGRHPTVYSQVVTRSKTKTTETIDKSSNWLASFNLNTEMFKEKQASDPVLSEVSTWVKDGARPEFSKISPYGLEVKFYWSQFDSLCFKQDLLVRKLEQQDGDKIQVLVPPSLREIVMTECHSVLTAGHLGRTKTTANVKRRFLWPGMRKDIQLFVQSCDSCGRFKADGRKRKAGIKDFRVGIPMERVCIDIVGPFPVSSQGNKYALVVTDCFTKYVEIYPMPNQEAYSVAQVLTKEFFSRFGVPTFLHSDQGTQFESNLFQEICQLLGIKKTRTTPFHPQSDGQSERNIKTLVKMVAIMTKEQENWDEHLPFLSMAYRSTPHQTLGISPNYMMFGREISMPVDVMIASTPDEPVSHIEYVKKLKQKLQYCYDLAGRKLKKGAEVQKRLYNKNLYGEKLVAGDVVWYANKLRKIGKSPKLEPKYRGPYLIHKIYNDVLANIQMTNRKFSTVHTDLLKKCHSKKLPGWLKKARSMILRSDENQVTKTQH